MIIIILNSCSGGLVADDNGISSVDGMELPRLVPETCLGSLQKLQDIYNNDRTVVIEFGDFNARSYFFFS